MAERAVRPISVVVDPPSLGGCPHLVEAEKPVLVEAFVAKLPVEAFDEGVFDGTPWSDEEKPHAAAVRPLVERSAGKLRTVVDHNCFGKAAHLGELVEVPHLPGARDRDRAVDDDAFAAKVVHDVEQAKCTP